MIAALAVALMIILTAGQSALTTLAEGFGWGSSTSNGPAAQIMADGFGWGAPAPVSTPGQP
ncbi:hypothetical protein ACPFP2_22305 [Micromonospora citrea]|uniref:hypothetical protein n=1 Tax=Micromonospora citrea TaxID=47855 RepID=UPI003C4741AA